MKCTLVASLCLLSLLTANVTCCQEEPPGLRTNGCGFIELLNRSGWAIPAVANATTKISGAKVKQEGLPDDVTVDVLEPRNPDGFITLVRCFPDQPGRLEVRNQPVRVKEIWRFKRNGRIFAYKVNAELTAENGVTLGSAEVLLFYDPDGSGQFKLQRDVAGAKPLFVPAWVVGARTP
jgi:hypothetical protein